MSSATSLTNWLAWKSAVTSSSAKPPTAPNSKHVRRHNAPSRRVKSTITAWFWEASDQHITTCSFAMSWPCRRTSWWSLATYWIGVNSLTRRSRRNWWIFRFSLKLWSSPVWSKLTAPWTTPPQSSNYRPYSFLKHANKQITNLISTTSHSTKPCSNRMWVTNRSSFSQRFVRIHQLAQLLTMLGCCLKILSWPELCRKLTCLSISHLKVRPGLYSKRRHPQNNQIFTKNWNFWKIWNWIISRRKWKKWFYKRKVSTFPQK